MASGATLSILPYHIVLNSALFLVLTVQFSYFSTAQSTIQTCSVPRIDVNKCALFLKVEVGTTA